MNFVKRLILYIVIGLLGAFGVGAAFLPGLILIVMAFASGGFLLGVLGAIGAALVKLTGWVAEPPPEDTQKSRPEQSKKGGGK